MTKANDAKSMRFTWNALLLASTALTGAAASSAAYAQDSGGLDDIIITATKREENLQDVPISVQALG